LAEEYLSYAREALDAGKLRLAIDSGYNSCELLVKSLIMSTGSSLSSSHGGMRRRGIIIKMRMTPVINIIMVIRMVISF
jgi:uncharacterized protein (UPF0332 family)